MKTVKQIRSEKRIAWHKTNKPLVFAHFQGICQHCQEEIKTDYVVHHFHYQYPNNVSVYDVGYLELIENNTITLLCDACHTIEHTAKDANNPKQLENMANCENCGRLEYGIFGRKKQQNLDKLLCRECFILNREGISQLSMF